MFVQAALSALRSLAEMGLDSITSSTKKSQEPLTTNVVINATNLNATATTHESVLLRSFICLYPYSLFFFLFLYFSPKFCLFYNYFFVSGCTWVWAILCPKKTASWMGNKIFHSISFFLLKTKKLLTKYLFYVQFFCFGPDFFSFHVPFILEFTKIFLL